jgi:hypothetical protein
MEEEYALDSQTAAEYLGVAHQTLAVWRMEGRGPVYRKAGGKVFYSQHALDDFRRALDMVWRRRAAPGYSG